MSDPVILVRLDGSEPAPLHILYVAQAEPAADELRSGVGREASMPDDLTVEARAGTPAAEILRAAGELKARLVVICKQGGADPTRTLGQTALAVLQGASCPLVLVPPEQGKASWRLQHILVPHDGTPTTSAAPQPAADLAERGRAELLVAHVTGVTVASAEAGALPAPRYVDQPQHEWPAWTDAFVKRLACVWQLDRLHVRMSLGRGDTAEEILHLAKKEAAALIVLAWRGRWDMLPRAATLKDILRDAHCPVMIVRA
jgi:nucleotide-binding universal stress UspA family protein